MAKRNKAGPPPKSRQPGIARLAARSDQSLILRSAETLGRMIGALQRQLDAVARHTARPAPVKSTASPSASGVTKRAAAPRKATAARKPTVARKATAARKTRKRPKGQGLK